MEILISEQLIACAAFAILGIITGVLYDLMRALRYLFVPGNVCGVAGFAADFIFDTFLMLVLTVAVPVVTYCFSYGKLRVFEIIVFAAVLSGYRLTLGRVIGAVTVHGAGAIRQLTISIVRIMLLPLTKSFALVLRVVCFIYSNTFGRIVAQHRRRRREAYFLACCDTLEKDVIF